MAKKIQEVDLPKDNYLGGYKPITPNFAPAEADDKVSSDEGNANQREGLSKEEADYSAIFLKPAIPSRRERRVGISDKHYRMLYNLTERLKSDENPITMVSYLSTVMEEHFKKYGKTIKELINKAPQRTEFDEF